MDSDVEDAGGCAPGDHYRGANTVSPRGRASRPGAADSAIASVPRVNADHVFQYRAVSHGERFRVITRDRRAWLPGPGKVAACSATDARHTWLLEFPGQSAATF